VRIISGKHKGRKLYPPNNLPVRPTTDYAKESLFNILQNHFCFEDLAILDCFSGTGNLSYEFLSRGVKTVRSIDANFNCIAYQQKVKKELNFENFNPIRKDVFQALTEISEKYNIIFSDPPYELDKITEIPKLVFEKKLLLTGGWLIIEHSKHTVFKHEKLKETRRYGNVNFSVFINS
jgi:16S rRNA (guanine(966)-N(2))-methyltransferase RsmD